MTNLKSWHPHVTVATIIKRTNQYLMVEERSEQDCLVINQPAGHVEAGEGIVDAAIQETLEETCWSVGIDHLIGIYQWSLPQAKGQNPPTKTYLRFTFAGHVIADHSGKTKLDTDIIDTHWLTLSEIENNFIARSPLVLKSIVDYESGRKIPLDAYQNLDPTAI